MNPAAAAAARLEAEAVAARREAAAELERRRAEAALEAERARLEALHLEEEARTRRREARKHRAFRATLRATNLAHARAPPEDADGRFRAMDSSIKRATALVKKLAKITEETRLSILDDLDRVNLSKYVQETARACVEGKLRAADLPAALEIVSKLHRLYSPAFATRLAETLPRHACPTASVFAAKKTAVETLNETRETETILDPPTPAQRRLKLRLLAELHLVGVFPSAGDAYKCVQALCEDTPEKGADPDAFQHALATLATFAGKFGVEFLGASEPQPPEESDESDDEEGREENEGGHKPEYYALTSERCAAFRGAIESFHGVASAHLVSEKLALLAAERANAKALRKTGELSESASAAYAEARRRFEAIEKSTAALSDALGKPAPETPAKLPDEEDPGARRTGVVELHRGGDAREGSVVSKNGGDAWDDEDRRSFYEDLPDVRAMVPAGLLEVEDEDTIVVSEETAKSAKTNTKGAQKNRVAAASRKAVAALLARLPTAATRESADRFASDFCFLPAGPSARAALVRAMLSAPEAEAATLAQYHARITATLATAFPDDVASVAVAALVAEFDALREDTRGGGFPSAASHSQKTNKASRRRLANAAFLGELVKFRVVTPDVAFDRVLKPLIESFAGPGGSRDAETACVFLETCGRFLVRHADPSVARRAAALVDVFARRGHATFEGGANDGPQSAAMRDAIDAAYYACKPPESARVRRARKPPKDAYQLYVRHLLRDVLRVDSVALVTTKLRKLPDWRAREAFVAATLCKPHLGREDAPAASARLVASLGRFRPAFPTRVADRALEALGPSALETNRQRDRQRRVALATMLGEMHNARVVSAGVVFAQLYLHVDAPRFSTQTGADVDPPGDATRLRVVCALMTACEDALARGPPRKQLDRFLRFFRRYALGKPTLDSEALLDVQETIERLRPGAFKPLVARGEGEAAETLEEADAACAEIVAREAERDERAEGGGGGDGAANENENEGAANGNESERSDRGSRGGGGFEDEEEEEEEEEAILDGDDEDDESSEEEEEEEEEAVEEVSEEEVSEGSTDGSSEASESDAEASESDESRSSASGSSASGSSSDADSDADSERVARSKPRASREAEAEFEREMAKFLGAGQQSGGASGASFRDGAQTGPGTSASNAHGDARGGEGAPLGRGGGGGGGDGSTGGGSTVAFKMLTRRDGSKGGGGGGSGGGSLGGVPIGVAARGGPTIAVPSHASFVARRREKEAAEARERAELKRLVLASADLDAEEAPEEEARRSERRGDRWRGDRRWGGGANEKEGSLDAGLKELLGGRGGRGGGRGR